MASFIKKHWFALGLVIVFAVILSDTSQTAAGGGQWLKAHHGPDLVIVLIFFFSGMLLEGHLLRDGVRDIAGTGLAFIVIFLASPLIAVGLCFFPLPVGLKAGLLLVAVMPCTLTSGVVMTGSAGGNMAHALLITVLANMLAVFTIPVSLPWCLSLADLSNNLSSNLSTGEIHFDRVAIMLKITLFVVLPLLTGLLMRTVGGVRKIVAVHQPRLQAICLMLVLAIVFMAAAQARQTILNSYSIVVVVVLLAAVFHGSLLIVGWGMIRLAGRGPGKRESILLMGAQKTLPLSVILQLTLFPQYGAALVVCVVHHLVHLLIDGFIVGALKQKAS